MPGNGAERPRRAASRPPPSGAGAAAALRKAQARAARRSAAARSPRSEEAPSPAAAPPGCSAGTAGGRRVGWGPSARQARAGPGGPPQRGSGAGLREAGPSRRAAGSARTPAGPRACGGLRARRPPPWGPLRRARRARGAGDESAQWAGVAALGAALWGEARRGVDVRPGCGARGAAAAGLPARPAGGWALAALPSPRRVRPPPPLLHCPLGAGEGKPPAGEGRGGAGPAPTDGPAGRWRCARGAGPGGGAGPAAQGSPKVTAARGRDGPAKSPAAAAAREGRGPLGRLPCPGGPGGPSALPARRRPRSGWSRGKCCLPRRDAACGARLTGPAWRLAADPQIVTGPV